MVTIIKHYEIRLFTSLQRFERNLITKFVRVYFLKRIKRTKTRAGDLISKCSQNYAKTSRPFGRKLRTYGGT